MASKKSEIIWRILLDFEYEGKKATLTKDHKGERTNFLLEAEIRHFKEQERLGRVSNIRLEKYRMSHLGTEMISEAPNDR